MKLHSETAWNIASKYSNYLASETRDLAAWIDKALSEERGRCARLAVAAKIGGPVYGANEGNARYDEACDDIASAIRAISEEEDDLKLECPLCGRTDTHSHQIP